MNLLIDRPPETVTIDGRQVKVRTDFRTCLRTMLAFEDEDLTMEERVAVLLTNLYPTRPSNVEEAVEQGLLFLNGGRPHGAEDSDRVFSLKHDAPLILAAFRRTHRVDVDSAEMHWWKFLSLFMDLGSDTTFITLVGLRKRVAGGTATKEERRAAQSLGPMFTMKDPEVMTPEEVEREAEFLRAIGGGHGG